MGHFNVEVIYFNLWLNTTFTQLTFISLYTSNISIGCLCRHIKAVFNNRIQNFYYL